MSEGMQSEGEAPGGGGLARRLGLPALLLLAAGVFGILNLPIREHLTTDQMSVGTMALSTNHPGLFASDLLYGDEAQYAFYLPKYRAVVAAFCRWAGSVTWGLWWLMLCLTATLLLTSYAMFAGLNLTAGHAFWGAILVCLPRLTVGETLWGAGVIQTVLPRTAFCLGFPLVVLTLFRGSFRGWSVPVAFLGVGLLANLHPQSALYAAGILGLMLLVVRRFEFRAWMALIPAGVCAAIGALPFVTESAWWLLPAEGARQGAQAEAAVALNEWARLRQSAGTGSLLSNVGPKLIVFALCVVPVLVAAGLCGRLAGLREGGYVRTAAAGALLTFAFVVATVAAKHLLMHVWASWLTRITWLRACRFVPFFGVMAVVLALAQAGKSRRFRTTPLRVLLLALVLVPAVASVGGMEYVFLTRFRPYRHVAAWAAAKTPPGTRFVVEPRPAIAFRLWSQRPVFVAEHDIQFFFIGRPQKLRAAVDDALALCDAYEKKQWSGVRRFASDRNIGYVVGPPEMQAVMEPVFRPSSGPYVFRVGP